MFPANRLAANGLWRRSAACVALTLAALIPGAFPASAGELKAAALPESSSTGAPLTLQAAYEARKNQPVLASAAAAPKPAGRFGGGQDITDAIPYPVRLRLGAMVSPRFRFAGGIDVTFPQLSIGSGWVSRVDADALVSANFGGVSTVVPITFNQVYSTTLSNTTGTRVYGGLGVGPYIAGRTRFGGKIFVGADFTDRVAGEVGVHFPGAGEALVTVQARVRL